MKHALPTATELSMVAATLCARDPARTLDAAAHAMRLWECCAIEIAEHVRRQEARERVAIVQRPTPEPLPQPKAFPATFDDFVALIIPGRTEGDRMKRFRDWIRDQDEFLTDWAKLHGFAQLKPVTPERAVEIWKARPLDPGEWEQCARSFRAWWSRHVAAERALAGGKRKQKPRRKKKTLAR